MTMLRRIGLFVSVAAVSTLLSAPIALADEGHGDQHRGRGDDSALNVNVDQDNDLAEDVNDDRDGVQMAPQPVVDNDQEINDLNDDGD